MKHLDISDACHGYLLLTLSTLQVVIWLCRQQCRKYLIDTRSQLGIWSWRRMVLWQM